MPTTSSRLKTPSSFFIVTRKRPSISANCTQTHRPLPWLCARRSGRRRKSFSLAKCVTGKRLRSPWKLRKRVTWSCPRCIPLMHRKPWSASLHFSQWRPSRLFAPGSPKPSATSFPSASSLRKTAKGALPPWKFSNPRCNAPFAVFLREEALGNDVAEGFGEPGANSLLVGHGENSNDALHGFRCINGMQGGHDQVTRFRSFQRDLNRFAVTHFANENDFWCLPERRAQSHGKGRGG